MTIEDKDRVTLAGLPTQKGTVDGVPINGYAYVRWDDGGGNNVDVHRLTREDKAWPPPGMEHK